MNTFNCVWAVGRDCLKLPFPETPTRRRASALFDKVALDYSNAMDKFRNQVQMFTIVYGGELFVDGQENPKAVGWLGMNDANWIARASNASADSSDQVCVCVCAVRFHSCVEKLKS